VVGAAHHRGESKQDYATPPEFIAAVVERFGRLDFDLAASAANAKAPQFFTESVDSLAQDWTLLRGNLWLNPPFSRIEPWAAKCAASAVWSFKPARRIFLLVPAAVGANWHAKHVHEKALVLFLNGRISFDGVNGYPKDCCLAVFGEKPGYEIWRWR
jgi:phage N-6-adenine-methyltransferase